MIQLNLDNHIYSYISQTGRNANLIIMHPATWQTLWEEVFNNDSMAIYRYDPSLKYKGIRVLRSLDIKEDLFEVQ